MKIVLCGFSRFAKEALSQCLLNVSNPSTDICVFGHENDDDFLGFARNLGIQCYTDSVNKHVSELTSFNGDVIISAYYRFIIKDEILDLFSGKAFNAHPSMLPDYRGCFSGVWAILNGESYSGATFHYMTNEVDGGRIILQEKIEITELDTAYSLYHKSISVFSHHFQRALDSVMGGDQGYSQDPHSQRRYYKREIPHGGQLRAAETTYEYAARFVRAMYYPPFKGAQFDINGTVVEINSVEELAKVKDEFLES